MKFTYISTGNKFDYEVPEGIDIEVEVDEDHVDFNFVKDGEIVAVYGGRDEHNNPLPTWEALGIRRLK